MTMRMGLLLLLILGAGIALADGTIDTTGATITPGAAPTPGVLTVDACAPPAAPPAIPALPALGTLDGMAVPVGLFPDAGTGADGAFSPVVSAGLSGGTYNYTGFNVPSGVTITYDAPVTLLVDGEMVLDGALETDTVGASITIVCSGSLTMGQLGDIRARQDQSPVSIDVGNDFTSLATPQLQDCSITGNPGVFLRTHGLQPGTGDVTLGALSISAGSADGVIECARHVTADGANFNASTADLRLSAFGGDIDVVDFGMNISQATGITVEASGFVAFRGTSSINTSMGFIRIRAHGGDVTFADSARTNTSTGPIDYEAAQSVILDNGARANTSTGNITLTGFGADVFLGRPGQPGNARLNTSTGDLTLRAARDVGLTGSTNMNTSTGDHFLHAHGGDVLLDVGPSMNQSTGRMEIHALGAVSGTACAISADSELLIAAGPGGIDLSLEEEAEARSGPCLVVADGDVILRAGNFDAGRSVTVVSLEGTVDVGNAILNSGFTPTGETPYDVTVASFAGSDGSIDAAGARIFSGNGDDASGDISLKVHAQAAIQPKSVTLVLPGTRKRPQLKVRGWIDIGPEDAELAGPATLGVGTLRFPVNLESTRNGRRFEHRDDIVNLRLSPPRSGSTRAALSLTLTMDLTGIADPEAPLDLRLVTGRAVGRATVSLVGGKFRLGKAPGTLSRPGAYLEKVVVRLKGGGKDSFRLLAGYAAPSGAPLARNVTIEIGDNVAATIPFDQFTAKGTKFVFKGDVNGVTNVTLDTKRGRLIARGKNLDYGVVPEGPTRLRVLIRIGDAQNTLHVGAVRTPKVLKY